MNVHLYRTELADMNVPLYRTELADRLEVEVGDDETLVEDFMECQYGHRANPRDLSSILAGFQHGVKTKEGEPTNLSKVAAVCKECKAKVWSVVDMQSARVLEKCSRAIPDSLLNRLEREKAGELTEE